MKKTSLLASLLVLTSLLLVASFVSADEITFSFIAASGSVSLQASASGITLGPSLNVLVSDATTGASFPLPGAFTSSTGVASAFVVTSGLVLATYDAGGSNSVLILDSMGNVLVSGTTQDHAAFVSGFPDGAGAFLSKFEVSSVSPSVLALFGLGPKFADEGSVSVSAANGNFKSETLDAVIGGGTVTITTAPAVPEPQTFGLLAIGLVTLTGYSLRKTKDRR